MMHYCAPRHMHHRGSGSLGALPTRLGAARARGGVWRDEQLDRAAQKTGVRLDGVSAPAPLSSLARDSKLGYNELGGAQ